MTLTEFNDRDSQADAAIKLFNENYSGREILVDTKRQVRGTVVGLNKHLAYGSSKSISANYRGRNYVDPDDIQRANTITYTVECMIGNTGARRLIAFELFMNGNIQLM